MMFIEFYSKWINPLNVVGAMYDDATKRCGIEIKGETIFRVECPVEDLRDFMKSVGLIQRGLIHLPHQTRFPNPPTKGEA
jgi:hypothetical protein